MMNPTHFCQRTPLYLCTIPSPNFRRLLLLTTAGSDGRSGRRGHVLVLSCGRFVLHPALAIVVALRIGRLAQLDGDAPRQDRSHVV